MIVMNLESLSYVFVVVLFFSYILCHLLYSYTVPTKSLETELQ